MNKYEAKKVCPEIFFVEGNLRKYTDTAVRFVSILKSFSPHVELFSIDEAFIDVTGSTLLFGVPSGIAKRIKEKVREEFGHHVTCSIGIAPNKLLAKLASGKNKPDGIFQIKGEEIDDLLRVIPTGEMFGIGVKAEKTLREMGIRTCWELGRFPVSILKRHFGVFGETLHQMGLGFDNSPVIPIGEETNAKSLSHALTLKQDVTDRDSIQRNLLYLSELISRRARKNRYSGRTVVITIRYSDFQTFTRRETLGRYVMTTKDIYFTACQIVRDLRLKKPVRLLGVGLTHLIRGPLQLSLHRAEKREIQVSEAMDSVNDRFGEFTLTWGSLAERESH